MAFPSTLPARLGSRNEAGYSIKEVPGAAILLPTGCCGFLTVHLRIWPVQGSASGLASWQTQKMSMSSSLSRKYPEATSLCKLTFHSIGPRKLAHQIILALGDSQDAPSTASSLLSVEKDETLTLTPLESVTTELGEPPLWEIENGSSQTASLSPDIKRTKPSCHLM